MRIALVKKRCSLKRGGSERYSVNLTRRLTERGHDVTVLGEHIDEELADEIQFIKVPTTRLTSWTHNRSFAVNAGKLATVGQFDIVYGLGRALGLDAVRVTERLQSHWLTVNYKPGLSQWVQRHNPRHRTLIDLERQIYLDPKVKRVVTQSRLDRELVQKYYNVPEEKIRTIYNGVDISLFNPDVAPEGPAVRAELGIHADVPLLLFASMDFEGKGLRSILKALANTKHRDLQLLVLGTGPVRKFSAIAKDYGVHNRVLFAGRRSDIQRCYAAADLFILPTAYEPFPNVNLEAMACGVPALTTNTAGGADVIRHGELGYLVSDVHAVGEMTACLDQHFDLSESKRQQMSAAGWELAQSMTMEKHTENTIALFEEVHQEKLAA